MTSSSERVIGPPDGLTTSIPGFVEMGAVLEELTSAQERYDHGFQKGYMAGYTEGARQAQAENAADLASHKAVWASAQARASALVSQLSSAAEEYLARWGARDVALSEDLGGSGLRAGRGGRRLRTAHPPRPCPPGGQGGPGRPAGRARRRPCAPRRRGFMREAMALGGTVSGVTLVADAAVGTGGCVVSCGGTTVDARVAEALRQAREAFCAPSSAPGADGDEAGLAL